MMQHEHHLHPAAAMGGSGLPWHQLALALMALAAVAALAVVLLRERLGKADDQGQSPRPAPVQQSLRPVLAALAALMAAAAGIHLAVIREHFMEDSALGWFFFLLTVAQLGYAALVLTRPTRWLLGLGILSNLAVVGLWMYTRTVGIPFGINGGEVEAVGVADVISAVVEIAAVAVAVQVLRLRAAAASAGIRLTGTQAGWGLMVVAVAGAVVSGGGH
jgi:hypothetical protein